MLLKAALFFVLITLVACASKVEVHVYSQAISQKDLDKVAQALSNEGFKITQNSIDIPKEINSHTLIIPPLVVDYSTIESVQATLAILGYENLNIINQTVETIGNHFYTINHLGLYLVNPDQPDLPILQPLPQEELERINLSHLYYSRSSPGCLETEAELNLFAAGVGIIEIFEWNNDNSVKEEIYLDGEWIHSDTILTLHLFDKGNIKFEIEEFEESSSYGQFKGINLNIIQNETNLDSCNYRYVHRKNRMDDD